MGTADEKYYGIYAINQIKTINKIHTSGKIINPRAKTNE